jgi:hypothetical protein
MKVVTLTAALVLMVSASALQAHDREGIDDSPSAGAMVFDLVLIRPLSLVATTLGVGFFVVSLPLAVIQGELPREPARKLVIEPARYTFFRRLGDMEYRSPGNDG